jgi:hypothetical protein
MVRLLVAGVELHQVNLASRSNDSLAYSLLELA